ncbi:MAG: S-layer homology domain-containing protein [Candidatus Altimarinota bacterium]
MSRRENQKIRVKVANWQNVKLTWLIVLAVLGVFLAGGRLNAKEFNDVGPAHDNYAAINYLSEKGTLQGYEDGSFKPAQLVNRAEALKIIFEGLGISGEVKAEDLASFPDVSADQWFAKYVSLAKSKEIISGNSDGSFAPGRTVVRAELMKMLLKAISFKEETWKDKEFYNDVPISAWFNAYMNYAGKAGLITADTENKLYPEKQLNRGEVAEIIYLLLVLKSADDNGFLLEQAKIQMSLVDGYVDSKNIAMAKRAAELSVDMTQQALKNSPESSEVLAEAKLAKSYDYLISAYILALQKDYQQAMEMSTIAILKADEATQASIATQTTAVYLKDSAGEIQDQLKLNGE